MLRRAADHPLATSGELRAFPTETGALRVDYGEEAGGGIPVPVSADGEADVDRPPPS